MPAHVLRGYVQGSIELELTHKTKLTNNGSCQFTILLSCFVQSCGFLLGLLGFFERGTLDRFGLLAATCRLCGFCRNLINELLHAASRIHKLLLARVKRMAL